MKFAALALLATSAIATPALAGPTVYTQNFDGTDLRGSFDGADTSDRFGATDYYNTANAQGFTFNGYTHIAVAGSDGALHLNEAANGRADGTASVNVALAANKSYLLSFLLSGDNVPGASYNFIASIAGSTFTTPGVVLASGTNPGTVYTYRFTTGAATSYALNLSQSAPGSAGSPIVDNLSISAVPEPAVWGMMILGFGIVGGALRRRKVAGTAFA